MEWADVATSKVDAIAINLIIFFSPCCNGLGRYPFPIEIEWRTGYGSGGARILRASPSSQKDARSLLITDVRAEELRGREQCEAFDEKTSSGITLCILTWVTFLSKAVPPSIPSYVSHRGNACTDIRSDFIECGRHHQNSQLAEKRFLPAHFCVYQYFVSYCPDTEKNVRSRLRRRSRI
jgi:hypothetical protein